MRTRGRSKPALPPFALLPLPWSTMKLTIAERIGELDPAAWDALTGPAYPFLRHEFLSALETHGAVGPQVGWVPRFVLAHDATGVLCGAVPAWLKSHSRGEFVFDFAWADAWERHGYPYYPKLVVAIPWTPATGPRLLVAPRAEAAAVRSALASGLRTLTHQLGLSGAHCLFTDGDDLAALEAAGFLTRADFHYFWHNAGYTCFDDYLGAMTSRKRKKIRQERRYVAEQGITTGIRHGHELTATEIDTVHELYALTFMRKTNLPVLTRGFFHEIARTMGEQLVVVLAWRDGDIIATAIMLRGSDTLYGRYWGTAGDYPALHFEACYYRGIDYCIRRGLRRFEPGAQGEHKIARGFLPTRTWSAHWIAEPVFRDAIRDFLQRERMLIDHHFAELVRESPFRSPPRTTG